MQPRGIEFLRPIRELLTHQDYLNLFNSWWSTSDIEVFYTKYINNYKHTDCLGEFLITDAIQAGLHPGFLSF